MAGTLGLANARVVRVQVAEPVKMKPQICQIEHLHAQFRKTRMGGPTKMKVVRAWVARPAKTW